MQAKDENRFWSKVQKSEIEGECWLWTSSFSKMHGHGWFWVDGKSVHADRIAWTLANGEMPQDYWIRHTCNNRLCVNPLHLMASEHTPEERFWLKVKKGESTECWQFTGARNKRGYGKIYNGEVMEYAHRFSWRLVYGEIFEGVEVCHRCDNPSCVNPSHLFLGTHLENVRDMIAKDRGNRGERQGHVKLTNKKVETIRILLEQDMTQEKVAKLMNVSRGAINSIALGRTWKHVS